MFFFVGSVLFIYLMVKLYIFLGMFSKAVYQYFLAVLREKFHMLRRTSPDDISSFVIRLLSSSLTFLAPRVLNGNDRTGCSHDYSCLYECI